MNFDFPDAGGILSGEHAERRLAADVAGALRSQNQWVSGAHCQEYRGRRSRGFSQRGRRRV